MFYFARCMNIIFNSLLVLNFMFIQLAKLNAYTPFFIYYYYFITITTAQVTVQYSKKLVTDTNYFDSNMMKSLIRALFI